MARPRVAVVQRWRMGQLVQWVPKFAHRARVMGTVMFSGQVTVAVVVSMVKSSIV